MQKGPPWPPGRRWGLSWAQGSLFTRHFKGPRGGWGAARLGLQRHLGSSRARSSCSNEASSLTRHNALPGQTVLPLNHHWGMKEPRAPPLQPAPSRGCAPASGHPSETAAEEQVRSRGITACPFGDAGTVPAIHLSSCWSRMMASGFQMLLQGGDSSSSTLGTSSGQSSPSWSLRRGPRPADKKSADFRVPESSGAGGTLGTPRDSGGRDRLHRPTGSPPGNWPGQDQISRS